MSLESAAKKAPFIALSEPCIRGNEWQYVKDCLDTGWVSSVGGYVNEFEERFKSVSGTKHCCALINGTSALHMSLMAAGIAGGDLVVTSAFSFVAPANAIRYVGADPVFIDSESEYYQMDATLLSEYLDTRCELRGDALYDVARDRPVKAILAVHHLGHPVDLDKISALAKKYQLHLIEDASESIGAKHRGELVGSAGESSCFSFNGNKLITTGGGGMFCSDSEELEQRVRHLSTQAKSDRTEYDHDEVGYNYRLSNVAAALGLAQLEQLDSYIEAKRRIAERYASSFEEISGLNMVGEAEWAESNCWMAVIRLDPRIHKVEIRELLFNLAEEGIQTRPLWKPLPDLEYFQDEFQDACPIAQELYQNCLCLPSSVGLSEENQDRVIASVLKRLV